jgi:hypothetical protein
MYRNVNGKQTGVSNGRLLFSFGVIQEVTGWQRLRLKLRPSRKFRQTWIRKKKKKPTKEIEKCS